MQRAHIIRLEHYIIRLRELKARGRDTATSDELAEFVGVSASRVRQDIRAIDFAGKPNTGYNINDLGSRIYEALELDRFKGAAIVGCGNLGRALIKSRVWARAGFILRAAFDCDPKTVGGRVGNLTVQHVNELAETVRRERITTACITVPVTAAQSVADSLVAAGIQGIWNFAPTDVRVPSHIAVENQRLEQGLMTLSYLLKQNRLAPAPVAVIQEPSSDTNHR